jgi:hypothetical protein
VDVLKRIHGWLRPGGLLLDQHSEPAPPKVEVVDPSDGRVFLGYVDTSAVVDNIHRAREAVSSLVQAGYFEQERSVVFDFVSHFPSVDAWLRYREERRATSVVHPDLIERARGLLAEPPPRELQLSERMLATRLKRRETAGGNS